MADQTLNLDGYAAAVVTAGSKWLQAVATGEKDFGSTDGYYPAAITARSKWFAAGQDAVDKGAHNDGYIPGVVTAASRWLEAEAVGDQRPANLWTVVPTSWRITRYKMRGMDATVAGLYDTWIVQTEPDLDGSEYGGALAKPLRDVIVIDSWSS